MYIFSAPQENVDQRLIASNERSIDRWFNLKRQRRVQQHQLRPSAPSVVDKLLSVLQTAMREKNKHLLSTSATILFFFLFGLFILWERQVQFGKRWQVQREKT